MRGPGVLFVFGMLLAIAAPSAARAQATAEDVIVTRDGAILHGHVAELRPGKSATIVLLTGESRVVKWDDIAKSSGPSFPSDKAPPPAQAPGATDDEHIDILKPGPGRVPLHVESTGKQQRIRLHVPAAVAVNGFSFTISAEVCRTPCTMYLPPGDYGVESGGEGITRAFTHVELGPNGAHVKLRVGNSRVYGGGLALVMVGAITTLTGAIVMAVSPLTAPIDGIGDPNTSNNMLVGGGATMGAGLAMLIPGAIMMGVAKGGAVEKESYERPQPATSTLQVNAAPLRDGAYVGASFRF